MQAKAAARGCPSHVTFDVVRHPYMGGASPCGCPGFDISNNGKRVFNICPLLPQAPVIPPLSQKR